MRLFDAHCHIQDERLFPHFEDVLERARAAGVERMAAKGCLQSDWKLLSRFAAAYDYIHPSYGLHPWFIMQRTGNWREELVRFLMENPKAAVGEIGLDHKLSHYDAADQDSVFRAQLKIACELKRPVTVHCRKAWGRLLEILDEFGPLEHGLLIHCYGGSAEVAKELIRFNAMISFSGTILRPDNRKAEEVAPRIPADRILVETDAPDLFPHMEPGDRERFSPFRADGEDLNEPSTLPLILRKLAQLRGETEEELAELTYANACRFFGVEK